MNFAEIMELGREPFDFEFTLLNGRKATVKLRVPTDGDAQAVEKLIAGIAVQRLRLEAVGG